MRLCCVWFFNFNSLVVHARPSASESLQVEKHSWYVGMSLHCNATNLASVFCERIAAITGLLGCQLRPKVVQRLLVGKPRFAQLLAKHHC